MRTGIHFTVTSGDRQRLQAIVADPKSSQKHVWRARIILKSDEGLGNSSIMAETGKSKTCVWRWQERFMHEGVNGLLRDRSRPPGKAPIPPERVAEIVRLTQQAPPHEATHWTLRAMAKVAGVAASTVQAIWKAHGLSPHRWRHFKLSNDPAFAEKLTDIVGLYVDPPAHAVVLSVDEKSQIQALDRTQPGLPMKKGRAGTMTYDYKRHGTTTLFAALNVLDGTVIAQNMQRHRHQEFIRFLNRIEREVPTDKAVHVILDNYAAHKKDKVRAWLARHPRWTFHFTPTSCSWLNAVEGFFAKLTRRRLKYGVFQSVVDLQAAINRFVREYNDANPKPFIWKAPIISSLHETEGSKRWNQSTRCRALTPTMPRSSPRDDLRPTWRRPCGARPGPASSADRLIARHCHICAFVPQWNEGLIRRRAKPLVDRLDARELDDDRHLVIGRLTGQGPVGLAAKQKLGPVRPGDLLRLREILLELRGVLDVNLRNHQSAHWMVLSIIG